MAKRPSFFAELKRRNVLRAVVLYAGAVWALSQGVSQLSPAIGLPDYATRWFLIACVIAFPFWVAFAWLYEFTSHGFKRESEVAADAPAHHSNARRLDFAIIGVLVVAVALLGSGYFIRGNARVTPTAAFNPPADSIVVLPFANLSDDPKQAYFSNGITEELTGALGQNTGLTVIAWDTASKFANSKQTPEAIGKALNIAHILDGSIQREGDEVRVSAELVSTVSGRQLWSEHYDASLKNIFAVQDKISAAIAGALQVKFAGMQAAPTLNPQAHEFYLKGLAALGLYTAADAQAALGYFQQALQLDPKYANAWAGVANAYGELTEISTLPRKEAVAKMRAAAEKALTLAPGNVSALIQRGNADAFDGRTVQAAQEFRHAIELDPSNAHAHLAYGNVLPLKQAVVEEMKAARLDPGDAVAPLNLAVAYQDLGDWRRMLSAARAILPRSPHNIAAPFLLAYAYTRLQRGGDAVKAFALVRPSNPVDKQLLDAGRLAYRARLKPALRAEALAAMKALRRANISVTAQSCLLQLYLALDEEPTALEMLGHLCATAPYACNDLAINSMYAPLHGDPRFEKLSKQYTTMTLGSAPASTSSN